MTVEPFPGGLLSSRRLL